MPKISNLPAAAAAQVTDLVAAVQGGVTKKETLQQIVNLFGGTITISESQVTGLVADLASKFAIANNLSEGNPATMRTNLGLVIGTNVQAWSAALDSISGLTTDANNLIYTTALNTYAVIAPVNNAVLVTDAGGVPSESTTLPAGLTIPGYIAGSPAALTKTDDTNVTLTLGGTPATALLQATSLTLGWTGLLGVTRGGTGVDSVTTAPTASSFAGWDVNKNFSADNFISGYRTTATAAGTTTLTVDDVFQQFFTGSTTQTVVLPVTSTLTLGHQFYIVNNSTGVVTVQSSGANTVQAMAASTTLLVTCINTGVTTAAGWSVEYVGAVSGGTVNAGTVNQLAYYAGSGNAVSGLTTITNAQNGMTMTLKKGSGLGAYTTTSITYVELDATNLAYTVTIPSGYKLHVVATGYSSNSGAAVDSIALKDGSTLLCENSNGTGTDFTPFALNTIITGDGASHTIALYAKTNAGTLSVANGSSTACPFMTFVLSPSN